MTTVLVPVLLSPEEIDDLLQITANAKGTLVTERLTHARQKLQAAKRRNQRRVR